MKGTGSGNGRTSPPPPPSPSPTSLQDYGKSRKFLRESPFHLILFILTVLFFQNSRDIVSSKVPTFVTVHTLCASQDTLVSYGWYLLIQGYFCVV